jgi:hypothetical protein
MDMSFTLEDLTPELFECIVILEYDRSSGLGGAGAVFMITDAGEEYFLGIDGFEHSEQDLEKYIPLLMLGDITDTPYYRRRYIVEDKGWKYVCKGAHLLIREDYYERISLAYEKRKGTAIYVSWTDVAKKLLDPDNIIPRKVYAGTETFMKKMEEERDAAEER